MNRWLTTTRYILIGLFVFGSLGATAYQWWVVWPAQKCDQSGDWWDARDHQCLTPMPIWRITGHLPTPTDAKPANAKP